MKKSSVFLNISNASLEDVEWREFVDKGLPFTVFLSVLSITGTLGNAMVFLTNLRCNKPSNYRILIQCLALVDFLSCAVGIPGYVLLARYRYTMESDVVCQLSTVFHFYVGICSLTILSFTAIERFRKTCKPFGNQFSRTEIKIICVCLNIFGLSLSAPSAFAFDSRTVILQKESLVGHQCKLEKDRIFSKVYIFIFVFCLMLCVLINTVFYFLIGKTIILQTKRGPRTISFRYRSSETPEVSSDREHIKNNLMINTCQSKTDNCSYTPCDNGQRLDSSQRMSMMSDTPQHNHDNGQRLDSSQRMSMMSDTPQHNHDNGQRLDSSQRMSMMSDTPQHNHDNGQRLDSSQRMSMMSDTPQHNHDAPIRNTSLKGKALYEKSVQISVMFLVCSLLSCASFVPLLVFRCIEIHDVTLRENIFETLGPMAAILNRFHVINHVINPIVYCLLSSNFRGECISLFRCKYN